MKNVMKKKTFIFVPFTKEGYHYFPGADKNPLYATGDKYDVSHLGLRHFHYFYFKVYIEVTHENREIEFIQFRRWLESLYDSKTLELDYKSCEMIADDLAQAIWNKYPNRDLKIEVSEDNINGCFVEYSWDNH